MVVDVDGYNGGGSLICAAAFKAGRWLKKTPTHVHAAERDVVVTHSRCCRVGVAVMGAGSSVRTRGAERDKASTVNSDSPTSVEPSHTDSSVGAHEEVTPIEAFTAPVDVDSDDEVATEAQESDLAAGGSRENDCVETRVAFVDVGSNAGHGGDELEQERTAAAAEVDGGDASATAQAAESSTPTSSMDETSTSAATSSTITLTSPSPNPRTDGGGSGGGGVACGGGTAVDDVDTGRAGSEASARLPPLSRRPTSPGGFEGGILEVTVLSARNVKKMDLISMSDVYAVITFGLEEVRSTVKLDVDECTWGQDGAGEWAWFFVPSTATERLEMRIALWDEDQTLDEAVKKSNKEGAKR